MSAQPHPSDHDEGIPSYLGRLTQAPLLTAEEEVILTRAIQRGDKHAKQRLIESNMRLVINIAKTYRNRSIPLEDLIQEGAIGLMQAAERFDPEKGFRFSTYATHWIKQAIGRAIDNKSKAIRLPAHVSQSLRKIEKERLRLARELGQDPTPEQLATCMGISAKKLLALLQSSQDLLSLDMTVGDSGGMTLGGLIRDTANSDPESLMLSQEMVQELQRILLELNEREQRVMRLRFRLDGQETPQQDEIAREMKLSRERIRQIEVQAIKKLRALAQRRRLRDMLSK
ncbi:MAG TPA: RNA polymerase sigma factor RpoD/SigA [Fimbriimonadaceae bacterium]|nr:RNA polymerase sigma factor RpoD/SigA [Fimbriimonadaceae bacterium]